MENRYGSILEITEQEGDRREGSFESAEDETASGKKLAVTGVCSHNLNAVSCAGGDHVVTYAGMFYQNKMETVWHVVTN